MNAQDRERWQQCQRTVEGLAEDMAELLMHIDELDTLDPEAAAQLCDRVRRTNAMDTPEYALAIDARAWLRTLRYLRDRTTLCVMLTNKLAGIMNEHRRQLRTILPEADSNDIEQELAMDIEEAKRRMKRAL